MSANYALHQSVLNIALPTTATTTTTTTTTATAAAATTTTTTTTAPSLLQLLLPDALRRMSVNVEVGLLSGMAVAVEAGLDETVATSKRRAQTALGVGRGRLLDSFGNALDAHVPIRRARVRTDDLLTLQISQTQVQSAVHHSGVVFAAILGDGSVVTCGGLGYAELLVTVVQCRIS